MSRAFRKSTLTSLQSAFLSAVSGAEKTIATEVLNHFHQASRRLHTSENAFNKRARPVNAGPSIMSHLRSPEHFVAMRSFSAAKEALLGINPEIGQRIVSLVQAGNSPKSRRLRYSPPTAAL